MGLKTFKQDVTEARASAFDKVSNLCFGDSEGEVAFTYSYDDLAPIEVRALATDVDSYPKGSGFLIFTSSEGVDRDLERFFQGLSAFAEGKTVPDLVQTVSQKLTAKFRGDEEDESENAELTDDGDDFYDADSDDDFSDMDLDPIDSELAPRRDYAPFGICDQEGHSRLKQQLEAAHSAGFKVGILSSGTNNQLFSLSIRVSKLGIPDEALEVWDLRPWDYIVLLLRVPSGYPSIAEFLDFPSDHGMVQFKFGKCPRAKPSIVSTSSIFAASKYEPVDLDGGQNVQDKDERPFLSLYISSSIEALLNQELPSLLNIRRKLNLSWDQAQAHKFNRAQSNHFAQQTQGSGSIDHLGEEDGDLASQPHEPECLQHDYAGDPTESLSIPLIAMQLSLQRLIRCNRYCMVCHQRTNTGFEVIKPYVCDRPLCLYQYLSLGFGQSVEHEIINSPYVVDLLVSFFYSATANHALREFPQGLGLKWTYTGDRANVAPHIKAEVCFELKTIRFMIGGDYSYNAIKKDDLVLFVIDRFSGDPAVQISTGNCERYHCLVESVQSTSCTFKIISTLTMPHNVQGVDMDDPERRHAGWVNVFLFRSITDLDDLNENDRSIALMNLTNTIPPILTMRDWLVDNPGLRLSSLIITPLALKLLQWIVASNRSFLVQDGPVPSPPDADLPPAPDARGTEIQGVGSGWMQFRFVQGSPEKEVVFGQELKKRNDQHGDSNPYPSLFAWHGSPLKNWHSIIRTNLDFLTTQHGRSFGHGVYMSKDMSTSMGYTGWRPGLINNDEFPQHDQWPNSVLKLSAAISMCEVVNQTEDFVSSSPYYVVNQVEWIQCRYLLAQVNPAQQAIAHPWPKPPTSQHPAYIVQDPMRQILGQASKIIEIPVSAIPVRRRHAMMVMIPRNEGMARKGSVSNPIVLDEDAIESSDDDLGALTAKFEGHSSQQLAMRKRRRSSSEASSAFRSMKNPDHTLQAGNPPMTDFRPGTLDLMSLPKLGEPTWASSSPAALQRLGREIKELHRIQTNSHLGNLGWYIDFDQLSNVFQWIVELHSFDASLPLAQDMKRLGCTSVVLEIRYSASFPMSPPFVRVIRPRFRPFHAGGGGHVTMGGSICSELLTNSGWSPVLSMEKVFLQVRMGLCDMDPPARLAEARIGADNDYSINEAIGSFRNAVLNHGWQMPPDLNDLTTFMQTPP